MQGWKKVKKLYLLAVFAFVFFIATANSDEKTPLKSMSRVNSIEMAKKNPIVSNRPAINFFEGAVLGNGGLGAIVTTRPDAVVIYFGHNDVWDIRLAENNKEKIGTFQEIFEKVKVIPDTLDSLSDVEWYSNYLKTMRENYAKPYPRPFPCGSVVLWFDRRKAELLGHRLNVDSGVCEINFLIGDKRSKLEVFVDMSEDRLWARMLDDSGRPTEAPFTYITLLPDPETPPELPECSTVVKHELGTLSFRQIMPFEEITEDNPYREHPRDRAFCLTAKLGSAFRDVELKQAGKYTGLGIIPGEKSDVALKGILDRTSDFYICVELDNGPASSVRLNSGEIPIPSDFTYNDAVETGKKAWEKFWSKTSFALNA